MLLTRGIKIRIYPNKEQMDSLSQWFGNDRFMWNNLLSYLKSSYDNDKNFKFPSKFELIKLVKVIKDNNIFLKFSESSSLQSVAEDLHKTFKKFFSKKSGYPNFKSKHFAKKSVTIKNNNNITLGSNFIKIPKLGIFKARWSDNINIVKINRIALSLKPTGKYYISVNCETENQISQSTNECIGIDLGQIDLATLSNGIKIPSKTYSDLEDKLHFRQRKLSLRYHMSKELGKSLDESKNYQKAKKMVAKYYDKIRNSKLDYLHKITHDLVESFDYIALENLDISNMMQNNINTSITRSISKANNKKISNQSRYTFKSMLEYKCKANDKVLKLVDPAYTSQTCSVCGERKKLHLSTRSWTCSNCGSSHDRDINAAINILNKSLDI